MLQIGLTGWGDHDILYPPKTRSGDKLSVYNTFFPVVEVDSSFYAVQPQKRFAKWVGETSVNFKMIVKAYQGMTGHLRGKPQFQDDLTMYQAFRESLQPAIDAGKLLAVLFQYPPWFDCNRQHVQVLRETKSRMKGIPCALEFRHQSWFAAGLRERTLSFMQEEGWIHSVCDEPQVEQGSVPTVLQATHPELTIVRLHGRNAAGWEQSGTPNWREIRYLYRYSEQELAVWVKHLDHLQAQSQNVCVIFNNNSGGDAAGNALQLMTMCGLEARALPVFEEALDAAWEQISLFDDESNVDQ